MRTPPLLVVVLAASACATDPGGPSITDDPDPELQADAGTSGPPDDEITAPTIAGGNPPSITITAPRKLDTLSSLVHEDEVTVPSDAAVTFYTQNCTGPTDPVMHLMAASGFEHTRDDDGGPSDPGDEPGSDTVNAQVTYYNASTIPKHMLLVVRAKDNNHRGSCQLYKDDDVTGITHLGTVIVGGLFVDLPEMRVGEAVETIQAPGGVPEDHTVFVFSGSTHGFSVRKVGGGTAGGIRRLGPGNVRLMLSAPGPSHLIRIIRNDAGVAGHDDDGDELGDELETALFTCGSATPTTGGAECAHATTSRDTDGDGIRDGWEVLGRRDLQPNQPLPRWGADPRHKDLFLEVDFMERCAESDEVGDDRMMSASVAKKIAKIYGDTIRTLTVAETTRRAGQVGNPDGRPGIAIHIDSGRAPETAADRTIYGDWGGHDDVPAVPDPSPDAPCDTHGQSAEDAWPDHLATARHGIFHYALTYPGGGGSTAMFKGHSQWDFASSVNAAHELGHSLGLNHAGPHFAYAPPTNPTCVPQYDSIMSYAYYDKFADSPRSFSDGSRALAMSNLSASEQGAVDPTDVRFLDDLAKIFQYNVDPETGDVDWNRDGVIQSTPVRAYINFAPIGQGCEWTYKRVKVDAETGTGSGMAWHDGRLYVAYAAGAASDPAVAPRPVQLRGHTGSLACPNAGDGCNNAAFAGTFEVGLDGRYGVAMASIEADGETWLLITAVGADGAVRARMVRRNWATWVTRPVVVLAPGGTTFDMPGLSTDGTTATVAYRRADQRVWTTDLDASGWAEQTAAHNENGVDLPMMASTTSPNLVWGSLAEGGLPTTERRQYLLTTNSMGQLRVYRRTAEGWRPIVVVPTDEQTPTLVGRPSAAWVPGTELAGTGRMHIAYSTSDLVPMTVSTYRIPTPQGVREYLGLASPFLNNTLHAPSSPTLAFDPVHDNNLRALLPIAKKGSSGGLTFYPNADGLTGHVFTDHSDWDALGRGLCATLMRPEDATDTDVDPLIPDPVACRPLP